MNSLLNYSLLLTIIGFLIYWFGMLKNKASPMKVHKDDIYSEGAMFFLQFLVMPVLLYYTFYIYFHEFSFYPLLISVIANYSVILALCLSGFFTIYSVRYFSSFSSDENVNLVECNKYEENRSIFSMLLVFSVCNVFILSTLLTSIINSSFIGSDKLSAYFVAILGLTFSTLSISAVYDGLIRARFRMVKIITKNESVKEGILLKHDDYVKLLINDELTKISLDCIYCIEEYNVFYRFNLNSNNSYSQSIGWLKKISNSQLWHKLKVLVPDNLRVKL